jgi:prophage maintenance system killer protein
MDKKTTRLDIDAIRSCLVDTQQNFKKINESLTVKRKPPSDEVIENLVAGYAKIDEYLANGIELFAMGNSHLFLELNHIVLYHSATISVEENKSQFKATQDHFYDVKDGGIGTLMEWLALNRSDNIWKKAAGVFTHLLSQPQLFLEGNHRTGSLIMSYLLMRQGHGPFVLSYENAKHFFEPAELTKKRRKKTLVDEFIHLPKQARKFAKLLKDEQHQKHLLLK